MVSKTIILAFDAYGTLLSTESIAQKLASHFGDEKAASISAKWRVYQLEYTWRLNSMNKYEPFSTVTRKALRHTLKEHDLSLSDADTEDVMRAYDSLMTFPDVKAALEALAQEDDITCVVYSQGTKEMVSASVNKSPDLSPHAPLFKDIIVTADIKKFKPAPEGYHHLIGKLGKKPGDFAGVWLVSGNPFDIVGARAVGMNAAWVDRAGNGWVDCLGEPDLGPSVIVRGLGEVAEKVKSFESSS